MKKSICGQKKMSQVRKIKTERSLAIRSVLQYNSCPSICVLALHFVLLAL